MNNADCTDVLAVKAYRIEVYGVFVAVSWFSLFKCESLVLDFIRYNCENVTEFKIDVLNISCLAVKCDCKFFVLNAKAVFVKTVYNSADFKNTEIV